MLEYTRHVMSAGKGSGYRFDRGAMLFSMFMNWFAMVMGWLAFTASG
jgi:hypothetical protein